jgi:hypothetical protein
VHNLRRASELNTKWQQQGGANQDYVAAALNRSSSLQQLPSSVDQDMQAMEQQQRQQQRRQQEQAGSYAMQLGSAGLQEQEAAMCMELSEQLMQVRCSQASCSSSRIVSCRQCHTAGFLLGRTVVRRAAATACCCCVPVAARTHPVCPALPACSQAKPRSCTSSFGRS